MFLINLNFYYLIYFKIILNNIHKITLVKKKILNFFSLLPLCNFLNKYNSMDIFNLLHLKYFRFEIKKKQRIKRIIVNRFVWILICIQVEQSNIVYSA